MKKVLALVFISLFTQMSAFAFCKLNQYGHNICTGEKGLFIEKSNDKSIKNKDLAISYTPITIKAVHSTEPTVVIIAKGMKKQTVHIDKIAGNKLCESGDTICSGEKVAIKEDCKKPDHKDSYKVVTVFENEIVELTTGGIFSKKNFLSKEDCIDLTN